MRIKDMITKVDFFFLEILITSPQYFYKKSMGTRWENLFFDIRPVVSCNSEITTELTAESAVQNMCIIHW